MTADVTVLQDDPDDAPDESVDETAATKAGHRFLFLRNTKAMIGFGILVFFGILAVIGPFIAPYDPSAVSRDILQPPSAAHWLGTTHTGQDVLSQIIIGTRGVLVVGLIAGLGATVVGVLVGVTAGYLGGVGDEVLSGLSNIFLVIPQLPLIIIIAGQVPSAGGVTVALVIAATGWAWGARVLRAQTLSLRRRDFVEAARASGESTPRIIVAEILPNLTAIIAAGFVGTVIFAVLSQVTLAFIGVTPVSDWNWGTVLFWAQNQLALQRGAWWWFVPAGLCIALLGMGLTLINFGIDEFINPRLRSTGLHARSLRKRRIRPRIGFTPVVRTAETTPVHRPPAEEQPAEPRPAEQNAIEEIRR
ncbi:ABC transporter permease [Blastococcus xanthinilyticus]|uniref:Peptide/nickel transport system permease protein n=1 Tax=Blastococcus xanthinilyticus TaxID=1564164 RepID=A0A5S5CZ74_9ACTN|nr:ABC transporter permease [Blastococcus xanthinilyticus]TYP88855.1 peptide/nickel transport system permease protein [Blastococcus xanthinilyticus]